MPPLVKAGHVARPTAPGSLSVTTGWQPTAAIWLGGNVGSGSWQSALTQSAGLWAGGTAAAVSLGAAPGAAAGGHAPGAVYRIVRATGVVEAALSAVSTTATQFKATWGTARADGIAGDGQYLILGGDVQAAVTTHVVTPETDLATSIAVDDLPFAPTAAVLIAHQTYTEGGVTRHRTSFGVISRRSGAWSRWWDAGASGVEHGDSETSPLALAGWSVDPTYRGPSSLWGTFPWSSASYSRLTGSSTITWLADGAVLPVAAKVGGRTATVSVMWLAGAVFDAGTTGLPTATTVQDLVLPSYGNPVGVLLAPGARSASGAALGRLGLSDLTDHRITSWLASPTAVRSRSATTHALEIAVGDWAQEAAATVTAVPSFVRNGRLRLTWSGQATGAPRFGYFAVEEPIPAVPLAGAQAGIDFDARARLGTLIALEGAAGLESRAVANLGGALVDGTAALEIGASADTLRDSNELSNLVGVDLRAPRPSQAFIDTAARASLTLSAGLDADVALAVGTAVRLSRLATDGRTVDVLSAAAALAAEAGGRLRLATRLGGSLALAIGLRGDNDQFAWPDIETTPGVRAIPGTINLVRNPSLEADSVGLVDWITYGAAVVTRLTTDGWHGVCSARVALTGGAAEGVQVATQPGLYTTGGALHGSIAVKAAPAGTAVWLTAFYDDGTSQSGSPVEVSPDLTPTPGTETDVPAPAPAVAFNGWVRVTAESLSLSSTRRLVKAHIVVARPEAGAPAVMLVDGAQVEYDRGAGPTSFAIGAYGGPYHEWVSAPNLSPSVRKPIPLQLGPAGTGGRVEIRAEMWVTDIDNNKLFDVTRHVISATVTVDAERDVARDMTCKMTGDGYTLLRPWLDWLSPTLTVVGPDGKERSGQLGHFVVLPSPETFRETHSTVDVDCRSVEYLLKLQAMKGFLTVKEGSRFVAVVKRILNDSVIGKDREGGAVKARALLPEDVEKRLKRDRSWEKKDSILDICNELLEAADCLPLWTTNTGLLTTAKGSDRSWTRRTPARTWAANLDKAESVPAEAQTGAIYRNEIIGEVKASIDFGDKENEVVVMSSNPKGAKIKVTRRIDDDDYPASEAKTGSRRRKVKKNKMLPSANDAADLADTLAEELGTKLDMIEFTAIPDPSVDLINEVVYLAIYDAKGNPAAVGRHRVLSVAYGFKPGEALMKVKCGLVHPVNRKGEAVEPDDPDSEIDYGRVE